MKRYLLVTLTLLSLTLPSAAFAYVGPGAGLTLLSALWGLLAAVGMALAFIIAWPIRKLLRRHRRVPNTQEEGSADTPNARTSH